MVSVSVSKDASSIHSNNSLQTSFFTYSCPIGRMGRLRQVALILHKKMQHAEVFEVMEA